MSYKKKTFFENRFSDIIGKPKDLWKALNSLDLPNKTVCGTNVIKVTNTMSFKTKLTLDVFKNCYSTLAVSLLKNSQPHPANILLTL